MSDRFITYVIIGVAFGFTQLWFAYWVVKLYKEKQRIVKQRKTAGVRAPLAASAPSVPSAQEPPTGGPAADRQPADTRT
jgi:hypothetical protein